MGGGRGFISGCCCWVWVGSFGFDLSSGLGNFSAVMCCVGCARILAQFEAWLWVGFV